MCDPITLGALGLQFAASNAQSRGLARTDARNANNALLAQQQTFDRQRTARDAEAERQNITHQESRDNFANTLSSYQRFAQADPEEVAPGGTAIQTTAAGGAPAAFAGAAAEGAAPSVIQDMFSRKLSEAKARAAQHTAAQRRLGSIGRQGQDSRIYIARGATDQGVLGDIRSGSASLLPGELDAARVTPIFEGLNPNPGLDFLTGIGQLGTGYGLSGGYQRRPRPRSGPLPDLIQAQQPPLLT